MDRAVPVCNKLLYKQELKHRSKLHKQKLTQIKRRKQGTGSIDQTSPRFALRGDDPKRRYSRDVREKEINAENARLVKHMGEIFLDNSRKSALIPQSSLSTSPTLAPRSGRGGLHHQFRTREVQKINFENHLLLQRLRHLKPHYSVKQFAKDRQKHEQVMRNICEYPVGALIPAKKESWRAKGVMSSAMESQNNIQGISYNGFPKLTAEKGVNLDEIISNHMSSAIKMSSPRFMNAPYPDPNKSSGGKVSNKRQPNPPSSNKSGSRSVRQRILSRRSKQSKENSKKKASDEIEQNLIFNKSLADPTSESKILGPAKALVVARKVVLRRGKQALLEATRLRGSDQVEIIATIFPSRKKIRSRIPLKVAQSTVQNSLSNIATQSIVDAAASAQNKASDVASIEDPERFSSVSQNLHNFELLQGVLRFVRISGKDMLLFQGSALHKIVLKPRISVKVSIRQQGLGITKVSVCWDGDCRWMELQLENRAEKHQQQQQRERQTEDKKEKEEEEEVKKEEEQQQQQQSGALDVCVLDAGTSVAECVKQQRREMNELMQRLYVNAEGKWALSDVEVEEDADSSESNEAVR